MKIVKLALVAFVVFASFPHKGMAQNASATAQQSGGANVRTSPVGGSASANTTGSAQVNRQDPQLNGSGAASASSAEMRPVNTELVGKLDSKSAKAGDEVVVKTRESARTADGTVIPKGTRLVGHVTSVRAHSKDSADSQMAIQFDRAELKNGQSLQIRSEIRSVAPSASALAMNSSEGSDDTFAGGGGAGAIGGARMGGGGASRGGLLSGGGGLPATGAVAGGSVREVADTTGRAGSGLGATADNTAGASGHLAGGVAGRADMAAGATAGTAAHATALRGVMLASDASGRSSGMLSASKQNLHLESGTQMTLGIAAAR